MKKQSETKDTSGWASFGRYLALGMTLPASSLAGYGLGYWLDQQFHTSFLKYVMLGLGTVGGFMQLVRGLNK